MPESKAITIVPKKMQKEVTTELATVENYISKVEVNTNKKFDIVKAHTANAKALIKRTKEFFKPHLDRVNESRKALVADRDSILNPLKDLVDEGARKNGAYLTELKAKEQEEIEALEKIEQQKIKDEAKKLVEKLKKAGKPNKAKRILREAKEEAANVEVVTASNAPSSSYSSTTRTNWKFDIVDVSKVPVEFLIPDEVAIGKYVREHKENAEIAGVKIYSISKTS